MALWIAPEHRPAPAIPRTVPCERRLKPAFVMWRLVIQGQPPSMNHSYHPTVLHLKSGKTAHTISKTKEAEAYQMGVTQLARTARPSGWVVPIGTFVRIRFYYFLNPDLDCDNVKKLVIDAIAHAIPTNDPHKMLNDRWVLTCDVAKERVPKGQQRLELEIELEAVHVNHS